MVKPPIYCIANPKAGGGRSQNSIEGISHFFRSNETEMNLLWTEAPHHATEIACHLAEQGNQRIIALGGDGTAFEVLNGIMRSGQADQVLFGIIPLGTGNSFLRDFGFVNWKQILEKIIRDDSQAVDVGQVNIVYEDHSEVVYFHNMLGLGFIAQACRLRHTHYPWMGSYAYHAAFFHLLFQLKTFPVHFCINDGDEVEMQTAMMALCNSQYTGHNMHLSPCSCVQDGHCELLYTEDLDAWSLLKLFLSLPKGTHLDHPQLQQVPLKSWEVKMEGIDYFMIDGEIMAGSHLRIRILPAALHVLV